MDFHGPFLDCFASIINVGILITLLPVVAVRGSYLYASIGLRSFYRICSNITCGVYI